MKKRKINALLAAGCLTLFASNAAQAAEDAWGETYKNVDATSSTTMTEAGATFDAIGV